MEAEIRGIKPSEVISQVDRKAIADLLRVQLGELRVTELLRIATASHAQKTSNGYEERSIIKADTAAGKAYEGPILARDAGRVVQLDTKTDRIVVHDAKSLNRDAATFQGKDAQIRYPMGGIGLVKEKSAEVKRDMNPLQKARDSSFGERSR